MKHVLPDITVGISVKNNLDGLRMILATVLSGSRQPGHILLRLEGEFPEFNDFYISQLAALARLKGVSFEFHYCDSSGIYATRQWQIEHCRTEFMLFLDDDVILDALALEVFDYHKTVLKNEFIYLQGTKADASNRRGYKDFSLAWHSDTLSRNYNLLYTDEVPNEAVPIVMCDMGHVLVNVKMLKVEQLTFLPFHDHTNAGGEDTLFGLMCEKRKLPRYWLPHALAIHLEKPILRFGEHAYRKDTLLRSAQLLELPTEPLTGVLPWEPIYKSH